MHSALARTEHRPWSLPSGRWRYRQSWCDLLFAHWEVPAEKLRPLIPRGLTLDEFEGKAYVGVVPFRLAGVMRRPFPDVPFVSAFAEVNLRTYVRREDKPGVWFLSLDAESALAVWLGRRFFHLPYHHAAMELTEVGERFAFESERADGSHLHFQASYGPRSAPYEAQAGTLDHFLTERYCFYTRSPSGVLLRADVHHVPWPLQRASAQVLENTLASPFEITLRGEPLVHFARRVDALVWPLVAVDQPPSRGRD